MNPRDLFFPSLPALPRLKMLRLQIRLLHEGSEVPQQDDLGPLFIVIQPIARTCFKLARPKPPNSSLNLDIFRTHHPRLATLTAPSWDGRGAMTERPARSLATIPCGETTVLAISKPLPSPKAKQGDSFPPWRYKYHIPSHPILLSLSFPHPLSFHSIRILNQTFLPVSPSTLLSSSASQCISLSPDDPYPHTPLSTELLKVTHTTAIMQFTIVALLSLVAVAFAGPIAMPQRLDARQVNTEAAAMSDASGNVVAFDSASVYKAATDAGL